MNRTSTLAIFSSIKSSLSFVLSIILFCISTASAATVPGAISGSFRVDESGQATYQLSIATVKGRGKVAPQVGISYSSQGGNGLLGQGWNISGQASISRCRQTWEQDGLNTAVNLSSDDRFCLNGQRLMLVSTGSYGAPNTRYKTEIDSQVEVFTYGGTTGNPSYFKVEGKDGSITEYGNTTDSKVYSNATGSTSIITRWAINKVTDNAALNNSYTYHYATNSTTNEHTLQNIDYSGATSNSIVFSYNQTRTDQPRGWSATGEYNILSQRLYQIDSLAGGQVVRTYKLSYDNGDVSRLSQIEECVGVNCLAPLTFNWKVNPVGYSSGYANATPQEGYGPTQKVQPIDIDGDGMQDVAYNSNGKIIVGVSNGTSLSYHNAKYQDTEYHGFWEQLDYNGDGKTDLLYIRRWSGLYNWTISLSDGFNFGTTEINLGILVHNGNQAERMRVMDVNGDALPDLVYQKDGQYNKFYVRYLKRDINGTAQQPYKYDTETVINFDVTSVTGLPSGAILTDIKLKDTRIVDFNADGIVDVFGKATFSSCSAGGGGGGGGPPGGGGGGPINMFGAIPGTTIPGAGSISQGPIPIGGSRSGGYSTMSCTTVYDTRWVLFEGVNDTQGNQYLVHYNASFVLGTPGLNGWSTEEKHIKILDINGDGLADIFYKNLTNSKWYLWFNKGQGEFGNATGSSASYIGSFYYDDYLSFTDWNHDGKQDVLFVPLASDYLWVQEWNGNNFGPGFQTNLPVRDRNYAARLFMDSNGDGISDYVNIETNNSRLYMNLATLSKNFVIETIDNGLGAVTDITYKPLTDSNVYAKGTGANDMKFGQESPVFDVISPMYVVSEATSTSPGITGSTIASFDANATATVKYRYEGARMQSGGRGFLGFEAMSTLDPQSGIETISTYKQEFPYSGRPQSTISRMVGNNHWTDNSAACTNCLPPPCIAGLSGSCVLNQGYEISIFPILGGDGKLQDPTQLQKTGDSSDAVSIEVSRATNTWKMMEPEGVSAGVYFPYMDNAVERTRSLTTDISGSVPSGYSGVSYTDISEVTTTNTYDNYSNPTNITVVTKDSAGVTLQTKSTVNTFNAQTDYARYGRLTRAVVTTTAAGVTSLPRTSAFEYHPTTMLLTKEIIEPDSTDVRKKLSTVYVYDGYGNIVKKSTCSNQFTDCVGAQNINDRVQVNRFATTTFDTSGTYVTNSKNAYGQTVNEVVSRNFRGQVTESINMQGVHSTSTYDGFGRTVTVSNDTGASSTTTRALCTSGCPIGAKMIVTVTTAGAPTKKSYIDALGRQVRTGVLGFDNIYVYKDTYTDNQARTRFVSQPYKSGTSPSYWTENQYDVLGRVIKTIQPDGFYNTISYNGLTKTSKIGINDTNINGGNGIIKIETKNALGQLSQIIDDRGGSIDYTYNEYGQLRFMYSRNIGSTSTITTELRYDSLGRKVKTIDPDMGTWNYYYNALGEIERQIDAKSQSIYTYRDLLGRAWRKLDRNVSNITVGDARFDYYNSTSASNKYRHGLLTRAWNTVDANYNELYEYDSLGRLDTKEVRVTTSLGTKSYFDQLTYDSYGRIYESQTLADGLGSIPSIRNIYKSNGYLERIVNVDDNTNLWQALTVDNFGNVTKDRTANGRFESIKTYSSTTGLINTLTTQRVGGSLHRNLSYNWDTLGNLRSRTDGIAGKTETFGYDTINRITSSQITGLAAKTFAYDDFGNITQKDGKNYTYGGTCSSITAGPHAVTNRGGVSYCYDKNGNQTSGDGRSSVYSIFNKPTSVTKGSFNTKFAYSPGRSRYKREDWNGSTLKETKVTATGLEVVFKTVNGNATTEVRRYVGNALMKFTYTGSSSIPTKSTEYIFKDHLGSTDTILTLNGSLDTVTKVSFSSFGERRAGFTNTSLTSSQLSTILNITDKGYTGHEKMDDVGLIHMNGRVYDPKLGRFMSADPHIQAPTDTQSLNRYSYVLNNPMSATDPTGYFSLRKWVGTIVAVVGGVICGPGCSHAAYVAIGAASGAAGAAANGGNILKGALIGAFTGEMFYQIGQYASSGASKLVSDTQSWQVGENAFVSGAKYAGVVGLHAAAGGVASVLNGGKFGHGFVSAGFGKGFSHIIAGIGNETGQLVVTMVVAGTASKLVGGKFANGANTAAFQYLMNWASSKNKKETHEERRQLLRNFGITAQNIQDAQMFLHDLVDPPKGFKDSRKILSELVPQSKNMHAATLKLSLLIKSGSLVQFMGTDGVNFAMNDAAQYSILQFRALYGSENALKFLRNQSSAIDSLHAGDTSIETKSAIIKFYSERWRR